MRHLSTSITASLLRKKTVHVSVWLFFVGSFLLIELLAPPALSSKHNSKSKLKKILPLQDSFLGETAGNLNPQNLSATTKAVENDFFKYLISKLRDTPYPGVEKYTQYIMSLTGMKPVAGATPLRLDFGPIVNDISWFRYPLSIPPCAASNHPAISVFVSIVSEPRHFENRQTIRKTWLRDMLIKTNSGAINLIGHVFVLGQVHEAIPKIQEEIEKENEEFGDILQMNINDDYYNLTLKAIGLLNWLNLNCQQAKFVLKADDDVYVNVQNLVSVLNVLDPAEESMYGTTAGNYPDRHLNGKWYISYEDWPWITYPPYLSGAIVLLSGKVIQSLLAAAQTTPCLPFDDTFINGLCAEKAAIRRRLIDKMITFDFPIKPGPCNVYNTMAWLTSSLEHLNLSHLVTSRFYENQTRCVIENQYGVNEIIDRHTTVTFRLMSL